MLLTGIQIADFSSRLPGPLASAILSDLGANVLKIEAKNIGDPFATNDFKKVSPAFNDWYKTLNQNKNILSLEFESQMCDLKKYIENSDAVIIPENKYFEALLSQFQPKVLIKIAGGQGQWKSLHDLNALGMSDTFKLHLKQSSQPPYLPFAGINFGLMIANTVSAGIISFLKTGKFVTETVFLKDATLQVLDRFKSHTFESNPTQLHNGALPCYNIYKTKDGHHLCLAAVEEKYWEKFIKLFKFQLNMEHRFDDSGKTFEIIQNKFASLTLNEIRNIIQNEDICLTIVD